MIYWFSLLSWGWKFEHQQNLKKAEHISNYHNKIVICLEQEWFLLLLLLPFSQCSLGVFWNVSESMPCNLALIYESPFWFLVGFLVGSSSTNIELCTRKNKIWLKVLALDTDFFLIETEFTQLWSSIIIWQRGRYSFVHSDHIFIIQRA